MMLPWVIEVSYSSVVRCFGQRLKPQAANLQNKAWDSVTCDHALSHLHNLFSGGVRA